MGNKLEVEKIPKLLTSLAIPAICAQIVTLLYSIVDRIYIGSMSDGALAMAGIGITVPIISIISAFTGLFGRGGAPLTAIKLGEKNKEEAESIMANSFVSLVLTSVIITLTLIFFKEDILLLFGATENILGYSMDYIGIYALGTVFVQLTVGMNYFINTQGFAKFGMATVLIGAGINIILDPIFIFTFGMGVKGAALATIISQLVSCIWVLNFLFGKKTLLKIRRKHLKLRWPIMKQVMVLGSAPFFMSSTEGLLLICFNTQLLRFGGELAVSAMTIMTSMMQLIFLPLEGIAQGSQPIVGFNYGAKRYNRVIKTIKLCVIVSITYSALAMMAMELFPKVFVSMFTRDKELLELSSDMLRIYIFGAIIMGANSVFQQTYNALGEGKKAFFFAFYRKIILLIPLIYILPMFLPNQLLAVVLAEPISDILTTITNGMYFRVFIKKKLVKRRELNKTEMLTV